MSQPLPLQIVPPDNRFQSPHQNPNPNPSTSRSPASQPWQEIARAWLSSLPKNRNPTTGEIDTWIDSNQAVLPEDFRSLSRPELHKWFLSLHNPALGPHQVETSGQVEFPYRFQRTDLWKPVYRWLESLDKDVLVSGKEISEWLSANPLVMERLFSKHSQYHMMHYIQRMHLKLLKKRGKLPKSLQLSAARASVKALNVGITTREAPLPCKFSGSVLRDNKVLLSKKKEAFLRYELLTDLQSQLTSVLLRHKHAIDFKESCHSDNNTNLHSSTVGRKDVCAQVMPENTSHSRDVVSIQVTEQSNPRLLLETKSGRKRKRNPVIVTPAWSYSEASCGASQVDQPSNSHYEEARNLNIWKGDTHSSASQRSSSRNIFSCLQGREKGISWQLAYSHGAYAGRNQEKWIPFLEGWRSLENQFEGPAVWLTKRSYSSWVPTWCAYTSSMALPQPNGRQGVQKVLDVRFHPEGLPQLVCSSNEAPNELLLYNLLSGRAVQLSGHNCQIQAVEFAVKGASVVSCGSNWLKVWDCITGSCLFTLGSTGDDRASIGHTQKINAMTVNSWQSCLVVTSGAKGDGKLLLWNALRGELAADLNSNLRIRDQVYPSIDAMEFGSENLLVCGSDCEYGGPAVVQLWDIESPESCLSFPANDSYITSLKTNPACNTIITGAGDGTVGLFDIRTCAAINHLSVGSGHEVALGASCQSNDMRFFRPLHCLSHGKQMPTAEHAGQLPGHVDEGDQGVNDARWLQREPVLVTVSGDGSMAMWNVALGQPCVRHIMSHTRCVNTVAVAPNDEYLCTGGDDQKVVLYQNNNAGTHKKWRLSHPLNGNN
uniref:Uncharacterized protein LOC105049689 isoform X2 n=1 Tax=Elaeis guineensis var. tenera TaxID=51953 RepID=A0A6I9RJU1_ELAGV|nr:uncharacterized protein LOC105049689 isoform X2 [Elaeis guineensis]